MSPILTALSLIAIAVVIASQTVYLENQNCRTDSECPLDHCCRLGPMRYSIPSCFPYQHKGEQCRVNAETISTNLSYPDNSQIEVKDINFILCPCADGLSCHQQKGICS